MHDDTISRVEAWELQLDLPVDLQLGAIRYSTRDYTLVRMDLASGVSGYAVGYTRGTPLTTSVRQLALRAIGQPAVPDELIGGFKASYAPGWGALVRAASLLDIALRDADARARGLPLHSTLSESHHNFGLMAVGGYFLGKRSRGEILDEISRFVDEGYKRIKLIVPGQDVEEDRRFITEVQERLRSGVGLAVDVHGALRSLAEADRYVAALADAGLDFLEDPFPSFELDQTIQLAGQVQTPIAAGEDAIASATFRTLARGGVRVLRGDVTASGGYQAVLDAAATALENGGTVAPHVWPYLHAPLAIASPVVTMIEVIPDYVGADPIMDFMLEALPIVDGGWLSSGVPGLHLPIDWERVARSAVRTFSV